MRHPNPGNLLVRRANSAFSCTTGTPHKRAIVVMGDAKVRFRIVMIGDSGVGKTSIVNRFLRNVFDASEINTVGVFFANHVREHEGQEVELEIWDTAGQEEYRALVPIYFRNAAAALVVFDIASRRSFTDLTLWITSFKEVVGDGALVVVLGNKCDLPTRNVPSDEAHEWAARVDCRYFETSAATGQGITLVFDHLITTLVSRLKVDSNTQFMKQCQLAPLQKRKDNLCC
jgi:small GTP-binding protein